MLIVVRKSNVILVGLVFLLLIVIYGLNVGVQNTTPVTNDPQSSEHTVVLDAGHGGEDPGAVSNYSGIKEKDINLIIVKKTRELLEKDGYKVILTREDDVLQYEPGTSRIFYKRVQDLTNRKKVMDESSADVVVSVHLNKFDQVQYHGAQVFYPHDSQDSTKLGISIQNAVKEIADPENTRLALVRGKKAELPIMIFRNLKTPTVVLECGFLSNTLDDQRLGTDEYQNKLALSIKKGIIDYFAAKNKN